MTSREAIGIGKLCRESARISKEHGWDDTPIRRQLVLVNSEASECLEEFRNGRRLDEVWYSLSSGRVSIGLVTKEVGPDEGGKPEGIPVELADCVIRVCDWCGRNKANLAGAICVSLGISDPYGSIDPALSLICDRAAALQGGGELPELVMDIQKDAGACDDEASRPDANHGVITVLLARLVTRIAGWCGRNGVDLEKAVLIKQAYNETRSFRHGGKIL